MNNNTNIILDENKHIDEHSFKINALNSSYQRASTDLFLSKYYQREEKANIPLNMLLDAGVKYRKAKNLSGLFYPLISLSTRQVVQYQTLLDVPINDVKSHYFNCGANGEIAVTILGELDTVSAKKIIIAESLFKALAIYRALLLNEANFNVMIINAVTIEGMKKAYNYLDKIGSSNKVILACDNDAKSATESLVHQKLYPFIIEKNIPYCLPPKSIKDYDQWLLDKPSGDLICDSLNEPMLPIELSTYDKVIANAVNRLIKSDVREFHKLSPDDKAKLILNSFAGGIALDEETECISVYVAGAWKPLTNKRSQKRLVKFFYEELGHKYSDSLLAQMTDNLAIELPSLKQQKPNVIGFKNGVYNINKAEFMPHKKENYLRSINNAVWLPNIENKDLSDLAPNFYNWFEFISSGDANKKSVVLSVIYMVLFNRYDWQLFVEITGKAGSGKSTFSQLLTAIAGENNTASCSISDLETPEGRAPLLAKSLIVMPDQDEWVGNGKGLIAITGGDKISINEKYVKRISVTIKAVIIAINNNPMTFKDGAGGVERRRVNISMNNVVSESERDPSLLNNLLNELPAIVSYVVNYFSSSSQAKSYLQAHINSNEALEIKQRSSSIIDFCKHFRLDENGKGLRIGVADKKQQPKVFLYHAYLAYCSAYGEKPISVTKFKPAMVTGLLNYGIDYQLTRDSIGYRSNIVFNDIYKEWI